MTITATRPLPLTPDDTKILAHYAGGENAADICTATGFSLSRVGRVLDEHAGNNRELAHQVVIDYAERTQTAPVVPAPAAAKPAPRKSTPPAEGPQQKAPANAEPQATEPQATEPPATEPQATEPVPVDELEFEALLQAADATGMPRLQRAVAKVRDLAAELRTDLAEHTREARLRAEQAELEARLAAINEQLRPRRAQPVLPAAAAGAEGAEGGQAPLDTKAVRAWAAAQGIGCPARGRIPGAVADAYRQAVPTR